MRDEALRLAAAGWPVFPLMANGKRPATAHGLKDATTDEATIRQWWQRMPTANVGMVVPPGFVAIDVDMKNGIDGFAALAALQEDHGPLPATRTVQTPSGGQHLVFTAPEHLRIKNRVAIRPGLDVRAFGGYLVAPPSAIDGVAYKVLNDCGPAPAPQWLLDVLTKEKTKAPANPSEAPLQRQSSAHDAYTQRAIERATSAVLSAGEGARNECLNASAYGLARLAGAGRLDWHQASAALERAALGAGLQPAEIRATLESASEGRSHPSYEGLPRGDAPVWPTWTGQDDDEALAPVGHPLACIVNPSEQLQPPRWLLPGFMAEGLTLIAGGHGVGKSTALLPLACAVAGIHEHGCELAPKHWREVVYITEDVHQAARILHGLAWHLQTTVQAIGERLHLVDARRLPPAYLVQVGQTYRDRYSRTVQDVELPPLVVLDTQAATIALESENDNAEASAAVAALKQHFAGLPIWLVAHLAKQNLNRSDAQHLTSRGASAWEADANCTAFLVKEGDGISATRWLVLGKRRFEPRWPELQLESHFLETTGYDVWGDPEPLVLRWAIARPSEGTRQEQAQKEKEERAQAEEAKLRQEIRDAVQIAWQEGNPLNRAGVKARVRRKTAEVVDCIERLLSERWLVEIEVPTGERTNNRRARFIVNLSTEEHEAVLGGKPVPEEKSAIPAAWKKPIPSVPENSENATENEAISEAA